MSGLHEYPKLPRRGPEPLRLPLRDVPPVAIDDERRRRERGNRSRGGHGERDVTGSHVIVIDLA